MLTQSTLILPQVAVLILAVLTPRTAIAGTFDRILSEGWSYAKEEYNLPEELQTLDSAINFEEILANPDNAFNIALENGSGYVITNGPSELRQINEVVNIQEILANPEDGLNTALNNSIAYLKNVYGRQLDNGCPYIQHIVAGPCPEGSVTVSPESSDPDVFIPKSPKPGTIDLTKPPKNSMPVVRAEDLPKTSGGLRSTSLPRIDFFASNETVAERDLANLFDQEYSRAQAAPLLGDPGTTWRQVNEQALTSLVTENTILALEIGMASNQCQGMDITQEVMKCLAQMEGRLSNMVLNQSQIAAQMQASLLTLQQQQAAQMQVLANLSEASDESNRRQRVERDVTTLEAARTPVYLPGFSW